MTDDEAGNDKVGDFRRNLRLTLEYDGTGFVGWQIQSQGRSVQGELARGLSILLRHKAIPVGSGRTDAGVHALGQVAHVLTGSDLPVSKILKGLNGILPPDIAVLDIEEAAPDFHARFDAISKRYRYRLCAGKAAIDHKRVWTFYRSLNRSAMIEASKFLLGQHSFGAFCKQDPVPKSLTCEVIDCSWQQSARELVFEIEANRFLRHMVRIIVGTLVEIGCERRPPRQMVTLLAGGDRKLAGQTAPPHGLCLLEVQYR